VGGNGKAIVKKRGQGWGGKRPGAGPPGNAHALRHGTRALTDLLQRELDDCHPIGALLAKRRNLYVADLGGTENMSHLEVGLCERLAKADLFEGLLDAQLIDPSTGRTRKLSWARLHSLGLLRLRLNDSYTRMATALGMRRRERVLDPFKAEELRQLREAEGNGDTDA